MMQHARYVTRRDRQINENAVDARKIQAEIKSNVTSCYSRYLDSNYLLNCLRNFA